MYIDENVPNSTDTRPPAVALGAEERWVRDRDVGAGTAGSTWLAQMWNDTVANVRELLTAAGVTRVNGPGGDTNLLEAVRGVANQTPLYVDVGAADAYDLQPAEGTGPPALVDGLVAIFRPLAANTGASTVDVNGLGAKALVRENGSALSAGDVHPSRDAIARYDAGADDWRLRNAALPRSDVPLPTAKAESTSNTELTVEGALTGAVTIPDDGGRYEVDVSLTIHAHVESRLGGADSQVRAEITEDTGGGPGVVSGAHLHLFKDASGDDSTELDDAIQVHHRADAVPGTTYTYAAAIQLVTSGAGSGASLDADATAGVMRKHSLRVDVRPRP